MTASTRKSTGAAWPTGVVILLALVIPFFVVFAIRKGRARSDHGSVPVTAPFAAAHVVPTVRKRKPKSRSLVGGLTFLVATITVSLLATSGTYALWNGQTVVNGSTLATGSIGLTINGASTYTIPASTAYLSPGHSVLLTATLANTGTVPIAVSASSTTVTSDSTGMASYLTLVMTPVATTGACVAGLSGGTSAALASFNTTAAPYQMVAAASQIVCLEMKLSASAPMSVEGGSTTFRLNLVANQNGIR